MKRKYTKEEIMEWLRKQILGMPRPEDELKTHLVGRAIGSVEGKYQIYDKASRHFK